jgi:hypothetical protein
VNKGLSDGPRTQNDVGYRKDKPLSGMNHWTLLNKRRFAKVSFKYHIYHDNLQRPLTISCQEKVSILFTVMS